MKAIPMELGRLAISRQGHDKGRVFAVVGMVDERFVLIADGDTRKAEHPKKKQVKHLRALPALATDALEPVARHDSTADSAIRKAIRQYADAHPESNPAQDRMTNKEEYALVQK